jgi:(2R)-sulfolactate sulfo-lyase subunit beta
MGNIAKTGTRAVNGVLDVAQNPTAAGLYFMATNSAAPDLATAMFAGGTVLQLFPTGLCNIVGHPLMPVLKITANRETAFRMADHVDVDVSGLMHDEIGISEARDLLDAAFVRACNGRLSRSEVLGHREFAITRRHLTT